MTSCHFCQRSKVTGPAVPAIGIHKNTMHTIHNHLVNTKGQQAIQFRQWSSEIDMCNLEAEVCVPNSELISIIFAAYTANLYVGTWCL